MHYCNCIIYCGSLVRARYADIFYRKFFDIYHNWNCDKNFFPLLIYALEK